MVQGKFTLNLGEWSWLGCRVKGKASAHSTNKLYVKNKKIKRAIKENMCCYNKVRTIWKWKASEQANYIEKITWISLGFVLS